MSRSRSLRSRLLWLLLGAIVIAVAAQASIAYRTALAEADEIFDYHMQQTALSLRHGLPPSPAEHRVRPPATGRDDDFIVRVWAADGSPVFQSIDLPSLSTRTALGFADVDVQGTHYRVFAVESPTHRIQVAQDVGIRRDMARTLALRTVAPVAIMAPLLMAVIWWVVSASLAPVSRVRQQIARRQANDLSEVSEAGLPDEIQPLIQELNLLFRRLRQAFAAQESFVADAAHELRSPLAALRLQVQALGRTADDERRELAMTRLSAGIDRATHLVEQLLVLARQQARTDDEADVQGVGLVEVARIELGEAANAARSRTIDLGLTQADEVLVAGNREALRILVRNLIDNAIRYTPPGGTIDIAVARTVDGVVLSVDDSGPGIAVEERERVLNRFYRLPGGQTTGSGLGLAIVKAVAGVHGATLSLDSSARLGGLRVALQFPAHRPGNRYCETCITSRSIG
jgi:two-component system OmpR family sensor kinase